ncbi:hypothetical protein [Elioraea sp.]|uniref:hypothetical protein n=1 Tax=Elioraea sp. TaxID=2185103 RepID=UPI0025BDDDF7|nr:hypothetical protein [Elioraea sp.]
MTPKPATRVPSQALVHPDVADLCLGAQLVLCAARSWAARNLAMRGLGAGETDLAPSPCTVFRCGGVTQEAYGAFAAVLSLLGAVGRGPPDFRHLHDRTLSGDEEGLIDAIAALQHGAPWRAQRMLSGWFDPAAVPRAVALLAVTAEGLSAAGHRLGEVEMLPTLH